MMRTVAESRSGGDRGDNQIGDFVRDGGQNPSLEESIKLEPFIIVFRERDDGAVDVALEIESADQEEKETTPLLVVRLREAEKNRNMEFDVGDRRESKMRRLGRGDVGVGGDLAVGHWVEESRRREEERRREAAAGDERERRRCCRWNCREGEPRGFCVNVSHSPLSMTLQSALSRIGLRRLPECCSLAGRSSAAGIRCFSDGGRVLSEEQRAKETVYIQKMERERLEKKKKEEEMAKAQEVKMGKNIEEEIGKN
ncbi:unnamed protein product [Cuscuta campestris]|uniref:Uncharacterized protein n=1 Tax=Cuscuta campestris TaxID=132261 RepID=A0A484LYA3_9ASTE|nr:unnamed protein product [Cuscuta campestris]